MSEPVETFNQRVAYVEININPYQGLKPDFVLWLPLVIKLKSTLIPIRD